MIDNNEKAINYAKLKKRLSLAIKYEFWFEACMIEYAIIEDRTASILISAGVLTEENAYDKKLSNKLNSIKYQIGKGNRIITPKMSSELLNRISVWKDARNEIVHRCCIKKWDDQSLKDVALNGQQLVREIDNAASRVARLNKKLNTK